MATLWINPATGSDSNDGLSQGAPILTVGKLNTMLTANGLVMRLRMDDKAGSKVKDELGNSTGTKNAGVTIQQDGAFTGSKSFAFDGAGVVSLGDATTNRLGGSTWSIGFWFKRNGSQSNRYVFNRGAPLAILFGYVADKFEIFATGMTGITQANLRTYSQITVADDNWHHICWVNTGTALKCYKDGVEVASTTVTFTLAGTGGTPYVGAADGAGLAGMTGNLDDFCFWSTALSPTQVAALYANGYPLADYSAVVFDLTTADLVVDAQITIPGSQPDIEVYSVGDNWITGWAAVSTWAKTGGYTNIYESTDTESESTLTEDHKMLNRQIGANFAAVAAALDGTPGQFYNDYGAGTPKIYVHAIGSTVPGSDGKTYRRSKLLGSASVNIMSVTAEGANVHDLQIRGGWFVGQNDSDPSAAHYCIASHPMLDGIAFSDLELWDGDKHAFGLIGGPSNGTATMTRVNCHRGNPHLSSGGQTPYVCYADTTALAPTGMTATFIECSSDGDTATPLSTAARFSYANHPVEYPLFYSHSSGSGQQWANIVFQQCDFGTGLCSLSDGVVSGAITIDRCVIGSFSATGSAVTANRSKFTVSAPGSTTSTTATNCILVPKKAVNAAGVLIVENCTIDATGMTSGSGTGVWARSAAMTDFTFKNNAVYIPASASDFVVATGLVSGEIAAYHFDNNVYVLDSNLVVSYDSTKRTLTYWKATPAQDANSEEVAALLVNTTTYRPTSSSPVKKAGAAIVGISGAADYYGRNRPATGAVDAGAVEFVLPGGNGLAIGMGIGIGL